MMYVSVLICVMPAFIASEKPHFTNITYIDATRNGSSGIITSPSYPRNYPFNSAYRWILKTGNQNTIVFFKFKVFNIKKYKDGKDCDDYLQIIETEPCCYQAMKRCGDFKPFNLTVKGNINISFVSDNLDNTKGFNLTWKVNIPRTPATSTSLWTSKIQTKFFAKIMSTTTGPKTLGTTDTETPTAKTEYFMRKSSQMASHKQNTHTTDTTRKTSTLKPTEFTTQQQNSTAGDLDIKIQSDEIIYLVAGIGVVELTLVALAIYIVKHRRANVSIGKNDKDKPHPVSRKSVVSVGNVYESIPLEHFSIKDAIPKEDEDVYTEAPEHMYDKTFEHRPHVNVNPNLYQLLSELKSKNR